MFPKTTNEEIPCKCIAYIYTQEQDQNDSSIRTDWLTEKQKNVDIFPG
jgi:SET domain-containing protein